MDDGPPLKRKAHVIVIGNVGFLQGNIQLIPGARADDGLLDVLVASPRGMRDWVRITTQVLTRRRRTDAQLDRLTGQQGDRSAWTAGTSYQVDGDTVGECSTHDRGGPARRAAAAHPAGLGAGPAPAEATSTTSRRPWRSPTGIRRPAVCPGVRFGGR